MCINIRQAGEQIRVSARARDSASLDTDSRIYKYIKRSGRRVPTRRLIFVISRSIRARWRTESRRRRRRHHRRPDIYKDIHRYKVLHFSDYQIFLGDIRGCIFDYLWHYFRIEYMTLQNSRYKFHEILFIRPLRFHRKYIRYTMINAASRNLRRFNGVW